MKPLISAALLSCVFHAANAAEWAPFFSFANGDVAYLDKTTIQVSGNKRIAWSKVEKAEPISYQGGVLKHWVAQTEVDCKARTLRTILEIGYQPDGSSLYQFPEQEKATPVVPDSMGEMRLQVLCKNSLKP